MVISGNGSNRDIELALSVLNNKNGIRKGEMFLITASEGTGKTMGQTHDEEALRNSAGRETSSRNSSETIARPEGDTDSG